MNKKKILIIANLTHSSPRIPGILYSLQQKKWDITIVTPFLEKVEFNKI